MVKVSQRYFIDEGQLDDLAQKSKTDFFSSSLKFYRSVKDKDVTTLTPKQVQWLTKLKDIVDEKNRKQVNFNIRDQQSRQRKFTLFPKKTKYGWVWLYYYSID